MKQVKTLIEKQRVFEILESSFIQSPGMNWMMMRKESRKSFKSLLKLLYHEVKAKSGVYITSDNNGVVFFYLQGNYRFSLLNTWRTIHLSLFVTGIKNGIRALQYRKMVASIRPKSGYVGFLVATDNTVIGNNAAYEIKNEMFQIADESNSAIYLETTSPRVRILYKKAGYLEYFEMKHPYADLTVWFFKRDPILLK